MKNEKLQDAPRGLDGRIEESLLNLPLNVD